MIKYILLAFFSLLIVILVFSLIISTTESNKKINYLINDIIDLNYAIHAGKIIEPCHLVIFYDKDKVGATKNDLNTNHYIYWFRERC